MRQGAQGGVQQPHRALSTSSRASPSRRRRRASGGGAGSGGAPGGARARRRTQHAALESFSRGHSQRWRRGRRRRRRYPRFSSGYAQFQAIARGAGQPADPAAHARGAPASEPAAVRAHQREPGGVLGASQRARGPGRAAESDGGLEGAEDAEGGQQIAITEEERAAIERLAALGFDFELAAEAFFACEKNEEMAANYLFDSAGGD